MLLAAMRKPSLGARAPAAPPGGSPTRSRLPVSVLLTVHTRFQPPGAWVLGPPTAAEAGAWWMWQEEVWEDVRRWAPSVYLGREKSTAGAGQELQLPGQVWRAPCAPDSPGPRVGPTRRYSPCGPDPGAPEKARVKPRQERKAFRLLWPLLQAGGGRVEGLERWGSLGPEEATAPPPSLGSLCLVHPGGVEGERHHPGLSEPHC